MQTCKTVMILSRWGNAQFKYGVMSNTIPCPPEGLMFPADPDSCLCKQTKIELRLICVDTFRNVPTKKALYSQRMMRQALKMSVFCLISWSQFGPSHPELISQCVQWISNTSEELWCSDAKAIFFSVCVCVHCSFSADGILYGSSYSGKRVIICRRIIPHTYTTLAQFNHISLSLFSSVSFYLNQSSCVQFYLCLTASDKRVEFA